MQEKLPCASGIYQIRCIPTDKIYIGSTVNLRSRWGQHQRSLRQGKHANSHLQNAWDRYGEAAFEFSVLEYVDRAALLDAEQKWLDESRCADKSIGFNLSTIAGSPGETQVQVWEGFIDPEGNEVTITNLFDFCRQNNLDWPSTHRLANGKSKLKSYKGWTHKNSIRQRAYIKTYEGFIAPDGSSQGSITNLAAFCREHGPDNTHMVAVMRGRIYGHRGWTYANGREHLGGPKTYSGFITPSGQQVVIRNLRAFCREQQLTIVHMYKLISGERKSHKGWTWRESDEQSGT